MPNSNSSKKALNYFKPCKLSSKSILENFQISLRKKLKQELLSAKRPCAGSAAEAASAQPAEEERVREQTLEELARQLFAAKDRQPAAKLFATWDLILEKVVLQDANLKEVTNNHADFRILNFAFWQISEVLQTGKEAQNEFLENKQLLVKVMKSIQN